MEKACLFSVAALLASEVVSFLFLFLFYVVDINKKYGKYREKESEDLKKKMLGIALPTAFTSYFRSALVTIEHLLITSGLKKNGLSQSEAVASYGVMQAKALPTILFPYCFLTPFCSLIVPEIAEKRTAGDTVGILRISSRACRLVFTFGICIAGIVSCYCAEIGTVIYSDASAGRYIRLLAPVMPVMFIDTTIDSILKGLDQQLYTMKVNLMDSLLSVGIVFLLIPKIGMLGYIIEIIFCEILNTTLSASRLISLTKLRIDFVKWIALPLASTAASLFLTKLIFGLIGLGSAHNIPLLALHILTVVLIYRGILSVFDRDFLRKIREFFGKGKYLQKKT